MGFYSLSRLAVDEEMKIILIWIIGIQNIDNGEFWLGNRGSQGYLSLGLGLVLYIRLRLVNTTYYIPFQYKVITCHHTLLGISSSRMLLMDSMTMALSTWGLSLAYSGCCLLHRWPIRGQYSGHMINDDQSQVTIAATFMPLTQIMDRKNTYPENIIFGK